MRKLAILLILVLAASLKAFAASAAVVDIEPAGMNKVTIYYLVEPGDENDTYSELAQEIYGNSEFWRIIWEKNLIPADEIKYGEILEIPVTSLSVDLVKDKLLAQGVPVRLIEDTGEKQLLQALVAIKRSIREMGNSTNEEILQTRDRIRSLQDDLAAARGSLSSIEKQVSQAKPQDINIDIDADRDIAKEPESELSQHEAFGWGLAASILVLSSILGAWWLGFVRCRRSGKNEPTLPSRIGGVSVEIPANEMSYFVYQPEMRLMGNDMLYRTFKPAATDDSWADSLKELRNSVGQSLKNYESNMLQSGEEKDNIQRGFSSGRLMRHKRKSFS